MSDLQPPSIEDLVERDEPQSESVTRLRVINPFLKAFKFEDITIGRSATDVPSNRVSEIMAAALRSNVYLEEVK